MINEQEKTLKEAVEALTLAWKGRRKPHKTLVRIVDVPAKIQTEHLPNISLECYF
jgi:hypothetical protein